MSDAGPSESDGLAVPDWIAGRWAAAKLRAAGSLRRLLADRRGEPAPAGSLARAHARLAEAAAGGDPVVGRVLAAAGVGEADLDGEDAEVLVELVAATIREAEPDPSRDDEDAAGVGIEHPEWSAIVGRVVVDGPGADASATTLATRAAELGTGPPLRDEPAGLARALERVLPVWQAAGVVDDEHRLTELGAWLLPRAVCRAWGTDFDDPDAHPVPAGVPAGWQAIDAGPHHDDHDAEDVVLPLRDGRRVDLRSLVEKIVATHRLTPEEVAAEALAVDGDLDHLSWVEDADLALAGGGRVGVRHRDDGRLSFSVGLVGPAGWLGAARPGDLVAVRVTDGILAVEPTGEAELDEAAAETTVARLAGTYDALGGANVLGGPLDVPELLLETVGRAPQTLDRPQPPLGELLSRAGLELDGFAVRRAGAEPALVEPGPVEAAPGGRGVAGQPDAAAGARPDDAFAAEAYGLDAGQLDARRRVLAAMETAAADGVDALDAERLAELAEALADPRVAEAVGDAVLGAGRGDPDTLDAVAAAVAATGRGRRAAPAAYLRARCAEHEGRTLDAEAHLHAALDVHADFTPALLEAAGYAEDRGEAHRAAAWLRRAGVGDDDPQLARLRAWSAPPAASGVGRNDPCPCGSGRKLKKCCGGGGGVPPLAQRAGWLLAKARSYADRPRQRPRLMPIVEARAGDAHDTERLLDALRDPLVVDLGLFDAGLLAAFLEERGALLPADEAALARQWAGVARRVYDVVDRASHGSLTLADVAGGGRLEPVRPPPDDPPPPRPGEVVFARVLPAEGGWLLAGGVVAVPAEQRETLAAWLDEVPDARAQAARVAELEGVTEPTTLDGEPLALRRAVYQVADVDAARAALDARFERGAGEAWTERGLVAGERWTLATLALSGSRLVVEANSTGRLERVRAALAEAVPDAEAADEAAAGEAGPPG